MGGYKRLQEEKPLSGSKPFEAARRRNSANWLYYLPWGSEIGSSESRDRGIAHCILKETGRAY